MQPYLILLIDAAINISVNTDVMFNVREVTIHFLELLSESFSGYLIKKNMLNKVQ